MKRLVIVRTVVPEIDFLIIVKTLVIFIVFGRHKFVDVWWPFVNVLGGARMVLHWRFCFISFPLPTRQVEIMMVLVYFKFAKTLSVLRIA